MIVRNNTSGNYIQKRRDLTLAIFHRDNPTSNEMGVPNMPLDNETYLSRKVGDMYLAQSIVAVADAAAAPIVPDIPIIPGLPVYTITCSDVNGISLLDPPIPTTAFIISPASPGVGVAQVFYFSNSFHVLYTTVISTTEQTTMPVPPEGTGNIQYAFRCTPSIINLSVTPTDNTISWQPLQFQNGFAYPITLSFTPSTPSQTLSPNQISTTVVGITSFRTTATFIFTSAANPSTRYGVSEALQLVITANGTDLAIQFFNVSNTLISTLAIPTSTTNTSICPSNASYFTVTPSIIYNIPLNIKTTNDQIVSYNGAPLLFVNTVPLVNNAPGESITIQYYNSISYLGDAAVIAWNSPQIVLVLSLPGATSLKFVYQV